MLNTPIVQPVGLEYHCIKHALHFQESYFQLQGPESNSEVGAASLNSPERVDVQC